MTVAIAVRASLRRSIHVRMRDVTSGNAETKTHPAFCLRVGLSAKVPEHVFKMFWKDFDKDGKGSVWLGQQESLHL